VRRAAGPDSIATFPPESISGRSGTTLRSPAGGAPGRVWRRWLWPTTPGCRCSTGSRMARYLPLLGLTRHPPRRARLTATIHDMTCWMMPELHAAANLRADRNFEGILRRADGLIAVSESTKRDAVRVLGLRPEKIAVIHSGIAAPFFDVSVRPSTRCARGTAQATFRPLYRHHRAAQEHRPAAGRLRSLPAPVGQEFELVVADRWGGRRRRPRRECAGYATWATSRSRTSRR